MWLDKLKKMKAESGLTTKEIADKSGIPEPTLEKLFAGATKDPKLATMQHLVHFLGFTLDDLSEEQKDVEVFSRDEHAHIKKYRVLDEHGKDMVDTVLEKEHTRCMELIAMKERVRDQTEESEEIGAESVFYIVSRYASPMSAGTGQLAGQEMPENEHLIKEPPRGTSYIAPVSGDSMEPTYNDGDLLFIHATQEISVGQVGVFFMDGQQWVKELGKNVLLSHNPAYDPIPMTEDIQCQGLVLGVCDESYFE